MDSALAVLHVLRRLIMRSFLLFVCIRRGYMLSHSPVCGFFMKTFNGCTTYASDLSLVDLLLVATQPSKDYSWKC